MSASGPCVSLSCSSSPLVYNRYKQTGGMVEYQLAPAIYKRCHNGFYMLAMTMPRAGTPQRHENYDGEHSLGNQGSYKTHFSYFSCPLKIREARIITSPMLSYILSLIVRTHLSTLT